MSAATLTKRPPIFSTYVDVDVDIDPEDLEAAGWVYVGTKDKDNPGAPPTTDHIIDTVRRWHDGRRARWKQVCARLIRVLRSASRSSAHRATSIQMRPWLNSATSARSRPRLKGN